MRYWLDLAILIAQRTGAARTMRVLMFVEIVMPALRALNAVGLLPQFPNMRLWIRPWLAVAGARIKQTRGTTFFDWRPSGLLAFVAIPLGWRAEQNYRAMPELRGRTRAQMGEHKG